MIIEYDKALLRNEYNGNIDKMTAAGMFLERKKLTAREEKTMEITFLYDADFGTTTGVILSTETTPDDIRRIVEDIREEKPDEWTWDDIWMSLPSDCYVCDREWHNTVSI